ncbi:hypothetical protein ACLOJK_010268 [Asimina triloba]
MKTGDSAGKIYNDVLPATPARPPVVIPQILDAKIKRFREPAYRNFAKLRTLPEILRSSIVSLKLRWSFALSTSSPLSAPRLAKGPFKHRLQQVKSPWPRAACLRPLRTTVRSSSPRQTFATVRRGTVVGKKVESSSSSSPSCEAAIS